MCSSIYNRNPWPRPTCSYACKYKKASVLVGLRTSSTSSLGREETNRWVMAMVQVMLDTLEECDMGQEQDLGAQLHSIMFTFLISFFTIFLILYSSQLFLTVALPLCIALFKFMQALFCAWIAVFTFPNHQPFDVSVSFSLSLSLLLLLPSPIHPISLSTLHLFSGPTLSAHPPCERLLLPAKTLPSLVYHPLSTCTSLAWLLPPSSHPSP